MPRSLTPTKTSLPKTIKAYSVKLDDETFNALDKLFISYGKCRSRFFNELCGINHMTLNFREQRNLIRQKKISAKLVKQYDFLGKHWTYALFETCSNLNSMWSNLRSKLKTTIRDNDRLNEQERHLLFFVLSFRELWQGALKYDKQAVYALPKKYQKSYFKVLDEVKPERQKAVFSYLRRITRRYKPKPRKSGKHNKSMTYDENMYRFTDLSTIRISSNKTRKVYVIKLTSDWHYDQKGNLVLVLDRTKKRLEFHKLIQTRTHALKYQAPIGIDKGESTLLSCSTGNEYGILFGNKLNEEVERLCEVNKNRNRARSKDNATGNKRYLKAKKRHRAYLDSQISHAVYTMLLTEKPSLIVKEDLTFTKTKIKSKDKSKAKIHRYLNSWLKGELNDRIEYLCQKYGIGFEDVNPAYTSQYCPNCGHKFLTRYGKHHSLTLCKNCGEMNANISASKNILKRKDDKEINLYTPYKKVQEILEQRAI